jgi:hypothetical protein
MKNVHFRVSSISMCLLLVDTDMFIDQDTFPSYLGVHNAVLASNSSNTFAITVDQGDDNQIFRYCNQNYLERIPNLLNFFAVDAEDWMSEDQLILTFAFGIGVVIVLVIKFAVLFYRSIIIPDINGAMFGGYVSFSWTHEHARLHHSL